jgi:phage shock protein A
MARTPVVGTQDFESLTALVGDGIKVGDAISKVASDRGASRAAVSANFYTAKRTSAGGTKKARRASQRRSAATPSRAKANGRGDVDAIARDLVANVQALVEAVKAQQSEIADLRERLEGVRKVIG